jgi:ribose transport system permease protein
MTSKEAGKAKPNFDVWLPLRRLLQLEESGILIALALLCLVLAVASPNFRTAYNLAVVVRQASFVALVALGETLVLLLGGIDLSVGNAAGFSAIVGALMLTGLGLPAWLVIPATAAFGFVIGLVNGFLISWVGLNPFIVTLASGEVFAGLTLVITKGYPVGPLGPNFSIYGNGTIAAIPVPILFFLGAAVTFSWVLRYSRFGRNIYAIGGNHDAAVLVGVPVRRVQAIVYGLAGLFAAIAGILYASRMDSAEPAVGGSWLMPAITAAIIGGTSLQGGQGTILGTVLGAVLMAIIANGMTLLNVSGYWERVVIGGVVLVAVLVDFLRKQPGAGLPRYLTFHRKT